MHWLIGQKYNDVTTKVVRPLSVDEARARDEQGLVYGVLLRDGDRNIAAVDVNRGAGGVDVLFFDENNQPYLTHLFRAARSRSGLFLAEIRIAEWDPDDTFTPVRSQVINVKEDGTARQTVKDRPANTYEEAEGEQDPATLELHYEPFPDFGDYASILRIAREKPVIEQDPDSPSALAATTPLE